MNSNQASAPLADLLVVDDTPDNLRLLSTMLSDKGYKVRRVINGQLALRVASLAPPDLILLDINMPQMNGYEVCEKLKADPRTQDVPVIFLSALDDVSDKVKAFAVGGVDYITKPFQAEEVLARVNNQLSLRSLQKQLWEQNALLQQEILVRQQAEDALKRTQAQLIQTEKMSSLGQLVAGIAHEINNPVGFIYSNLIPARGYLQDLIRLLELYQQTYPHPTPEIQQIASELDLDFLLEDWQKLMDSMQVGVDRIQGIVRSLQIFSKQNEADKKAVDIHECIDRTLLILQHRLRAMEATGKIKVIKDYGQLPKVICYPSQLNQVFMNLLNNAIDALESQPDPRVITISTSVETRQLETQDSSILKHQSFHSLPPNSQFVGIRIVDNGPGMPENVQKKIFDPFFTTKPVGSGTGLGLSTSYQIVVEKHQGQISCISILGQGTELIVEIPVNLSN
ncbi:MAG: response regulator [Cyanobacteriota bacterium]|nr:response regulator [Cyanobacteriota bacterium]